MASHWDPVVAELKEQGFLVEKGEGNHWSVKNPKGGRTVFFSYSDESRALKNTIADLRRSFGFVWPPPLREKKNGVGQSSKAEVCCTLCDGPSGCKNKSCECHAPEPTLMPKTSEELYKDLADSRITLQLAEEQLKACKDALQEAQRAVDDALTERSRAMDAFRAAKKLFDEDMLAGLGGEESGEQT
ncbi:MAG TPA: hypothetical protein VFA98_11175 [Thermoanaerobaculia bacterium]|jgi:hypothetical protein|nr:hypothetical protein [Thermoanaerobaculia bacterium]